jgi:hypothetical protein
MLKDLLLIIAGLIAGIINSVAGGGMLVGFPVLIFTGLSALTANATANIVALGGQFTASLGFRSYLKKIDLKYYMLLIPCFLGGLIGAYYLRLSRSTTFNLIAFILILIAVALFIAEPIIKKHVYRARGYSRTKLKALVLIYVATIPLSVYGGYFGLGAGIVFLAMLSYSDLKNIYEINGLKNVIALVITVASIIALYSSRLMDWRQGIIMTVGSLAGGYLGAKFAQRIPATAVRVIIITVGLGTAIYLGAVAHF